MTRTRNQSGHALAAIVVVVVLVAIGLIGWQVASRHKKPPATVTTTSSSNHTATTTPANATDNASLNQDLQSVNSSMNQESSDNTAAGNGLNDSQQEISVPTD